VERLNLRRHVAFAAFWAVVFTPVQRLMSGQPLFGIRTLAVAGVAFVVMLLVNVVMVWVCRDRAARAPGA
jgi:hypothetical protein